VADSLDAEAKAAAELERKLRADAARDDAAAGDAARSSATTSVNLESLEREAKAQRDLLASYLSKQADLLAANSASDARQDIRIISDAAPALEPASPRYLLVMTSVGLAVIAVQVAALLIGQAAAPVRHDAEYDREELAAFVAEPEMTADAEPDFDAGPEVEPELPFEPEPAEHYDDTDDLLQHAVGHAVASRADSGAGPTLMESQLSDLSRAVGEHGIVLLLSVGDGEGPELVVERLLEDAMMAQYSAVVVDAASGRMSDVPGITDLAAGMVDYGEALQRIDENLAEVPWGRLATLDRRSLRPLTMIEALADIYHLVVVDTGRAGLTSSLPLFTGAPAAVVVVATDGSEPGALAAAERDVAALGFAVGRVVKLAMARAEVA
jgi:hypothetical protein